MRTISNENSKVNAQTCSGTMRSKNLSPCLDKRGNEGYSQFPSTSNFAVNTIVSSPQTIAIKSEKVGVFNVN